MTLIVAVRLLVALLAEGVDRNTLSRQAFINDDMSPSSRRAWIEMQWLANYLLEPLVALLAEGVDRNWVERVRIML